MEDFNLKWIFYLLAAIYFIFRSRKKKPTPETDYKPFESDSQPSTTSKPVTFEDLLKEIQQAKQPNEEPKYVAPKPQVIKPYYEQPKYEDYDDNLEEEEKDLEEVNYDYKSKDNIYETYEKAKQEAFNRPSLEETMLNKDVEVIRFNHFKEYDTVTVPSEAQKIAEELKNPENMKKAVILSEILNRRF